MRFQIIAVTSGDFPPTGLFRVSGFRFCNSAPSILLQKYRKGSAVESVLGRVVKGWEEAKKTPQGFLATIYPLCPNARKKSNERKNRIETATYE